MIPISGTTRVAGLIGYPARYSLSPALHNAAYAAMDLDACYVVFPVADDIATAVEAVRAMDLLGASVTMPHKEAVVAHLDRLAPEAARLGAVNCIAVEDGALVGYNTDGAGFVASLREELGIEPRGARVVVCGAGGAARALVAALGDAGAADIAVFNRSRERAEALLGLAPGVARLASTDDVAGADLIVNATPLGMAGELAGSVPVPVDTIGAHHAVVDIVYDPLRTPLLEGAAARGARTANGVGMLVHQAAVQVELWTGRPAPVGAMRAAVAAHLG